MKLNYKYYAHIPQTSVTGANIPNIVILHGLFGSSKNWVSVAKQLTQYANVYALDQRNHGDSPHSSSHTLHDMVADLSEFLQSNNLRDVILLGHSMGGLVVMLYCLSNPPIQASKIIIQDIAPRDYPFVYDQEVAAMSLPVSEAKSRSEIDENMAKLVPNTFIRQFLQMNLERDAKGGYFWKINVDSISKSRQMFEKEFESIQGSLSNVNALFLLGGQSEYIIPSDLILIQKYFPHAKIVEISEGGHYIQFTHNEEFMKKLIAFLTS